MNEAFSHQHHSLLAPPFGSDFVDPAYVLSLAHSIVEWSRASWAPSSIDWLFGSEVAVLMKHNNDFRFCCLPSRSRISHLVVRQKLHCSIIFHYDSYCFMLLYIPHIFLLHPTERLETGSTYKIPSQCSQIFCARKDDSELVKANWTYDSIVGHVYAYKVQLILSIFSHAPHFFLDTVIHSQFFLQQERSFSWSFFNLFMGFSLAEADSSWYSFLLPCVYAVFSFIVSNSHFSYASWSRNSHKYYFSFATIYRFIRVMFNFLHCGACHETFFEKEERDRHRNEVQYNLWNLDSETSQYFFIVF